MNVEVSRYFLKKSLRISELIVANVLFFVNAFKTFCLRIIKYAKPRHNFATVFIFSGTGDKINSM